MSEAPVDRGPGPGRRPAAASRGRNETVCGLSLSRSQLARREDVGPADMREESGGAADRVQRVCRRCASVAGRRGGEARPRWHRVHPRP
ncbi:hypothetical protein [Streptomyces sp. NPDC002250]|uniref:hypothetical protein n=1 Tax=Streptomyces sp. NPDC002250 TaxID=3364641 RepID=UPI00367390AD